MSEPSAPTAHEVSGGNPRRVRPGEIPRALSRARRTAALYGATHPVVEQTMAEALRVITEVLNGRSSLTIGIHDDTFFLDNTVLLEESLALSSLLLDLKERDIGVVEIRAGLEPRELLRFVEVLNLRAAEVHRLGGAPACMEQRDVHHIAVGRAQTLLPGQHARARVDPRDVYRAGLRAVSELNYEAAKGASIDLDKSRRVVTALIDILTSDRVALMGVTALKNYDEDTCHHAVNVCILALLMASRLQFDRALTSTLGLAALLHDIGKTRIPREIVTKAGKLTAEEQEVMKRHPVHGAHLLRDLPGQGKLAMVVAFEHHANYDLSGYPRMTTKSHPHLLARIVQVVDSFDAATSARRAYRRPMLPELAVGFIIDGAGTVFDPVLAKVFVHVLGVYPVGTVVELDTGDLAVVRRPGEWDVMRPTISVLRTRLGTSVDPYDVDLEEDRERFIVRSLDPTDAEVDVAQLLAVGP